VSKKKITLAEMMNLRIAQREAIVWREIEHAYNLVKEKLGEKGARRLLIYFGIPRLDKLPVIRYNQFLIVAKEMTFYGKHT